MRLGNLIAGYGGKRNWAKIASASSVKSGFGCKGVAVLGLYWSTKYASVSRLQFWHRKTSRVHAFIYFFTGRVNGSRVHNYFSASIRTAGALLSSTDFIGITGIVNDIFRGARTEPLYKDKKKIKKSRSAELHQQALQWATSTITSSSLILRRR